VSDAPDGILPAAARRYRNLMDGTLILEVEFEPAFAKQAINLFAMPGTPMAVSALKVGYAAAGNTPPAEPEDLKGGELAKLAGKWCLMPEFQSWLRSQFPFTWADCLEDIKNQGEGVDEGKVAAGVVRRHCCVNTRAKLDHDPIAKRTFNEDIRLPFSAWLADQT